MADVDFLNELGELAIGSRLKRLGDRMMTEAGRTYQAFGHDDVQPKWFVLLALLHRRGEVGVVEAAEQLGITQPAISQFCRDLEVRGWTSIGHDRQDARKRIIRLTKAGHAVVEGMQPMWRAVDKAAKALCVEAGAGFLEAVGRFEQALKQKSLAERALAELQAERKAPARKERR